MIIPRNLGSWSPCKILKLLLLKLLLQALGWVLYSEFTPCFSPVPNSLRFHREVSIFPSILNLLHFISLIENTFWELIKYKPLGDLKPQKTLWLIAFDEHPVNFGEFYFNHILQHNICPVNCIGQWPCANSTQLIACQKIRKGIKWYAFW